MFILIVKIISKLVYPAGLSFFLVLLGLALMKFGKDKLKRWGKRFAVLGLLVFYVFSNSWVAEKVGRSLEWKIQMPDPMVRADGIIVLGGAIQKKVKPRVIAELSDAGDRLIYGGYLMKEGLGEWIICSGGNVGTGVTKQTEAHAMKEILLRLDIKEKDILMEDQARNTLENATLSLPMAKEMGAQSIYLVTSASHMPRSLAVFKKQASELGLNDLKIIPAPCDYVNVEPEVLPPWYYQLASWILPDASALADNTKFIHEYYGLIYYKIRGWI